MGAFKALIIKRVQQMPSDRELCRRWWNDPKMRRICDVERALITGSIDQKMAFHTLGPPS
jgi:hypothetical protein